MNAVITLSLDLSQEDKTIADVVQMIEQVYLNEAANTTGTNGSNRALKKRHISVFSPHHQSSLMYRKTLKECKIMHGACLSATIY
eukprot:CAMPEP_0117448044 /NCGR_PEP_ID=MMETSP0759-20121206/7190_1 /TAXON_ID=63605 /ORGANISM="Percolomonas cosmopolitus, Strain WS" /LENGTH=84 /DNA_ID=CAMNT_0005240403 /DNA_START=114 /DNA_END=368 /DNA_ORIENTATION=-